jgi:hypothetical protein
VSEEGKLRKIQVGDLVRLADDDDLVVGIGLVLEEREDSKDAVEDMTNRHPDFFLEEIPEYLLYKPVYLVLWQGITISPTSKPIWMFRTELRVIEKEVDSGEGKIKSG